MFVFDMIESYKVSTHKDQITSNLKAVIDATRQFNDYHMQSLELEKSVSGKLENMISKEAPECSELYDRLKQIHQQLLNQEVNYVKQQQRSIEDINDITERFLVVVRQSQKYESAITSYNQAGENLANFMTKMQIELQKDPSKQEKLEVTLEKYKKEKAEALENLKCQLQLFIEEKRRFNSFRARRMSQAYTLYGNATKTSSEEITKLSSHLKEEADKVMLQITESVTKPNQ